MIFSPLLLVSTVLVTQGLAQNYQPPPYQSYQQPSEQQEPYQSYQPSEQQEPYYPPLAQVPQPSISCCRSNFPEEYGSCRNNEDCQLKAQPYCSGFGYCTQIKQYGANGCKPC